MVVADSLEEVLLGVVHADGDVRVALRVGGPEDDDLVESVGGLEVANVLANVLEVSELRLSGDDVVGALLLVRVDELGVVERGEGLELSHLGGDLALEVVVEDLGATHGLVERHRRDVPSADLGEKGRRG